MASTGSSARTPKDAQVIISMLSEAGVAEYEPRVVNQLLEFTYRYVTSLLDESRVYALHAKKKVIDLDDVKLAITMQTDKVNTAAPPRDVLMEIAKSRNSNPLPPVKLQNGLRLPPDRFCLSSCNYKLQIAKKPVSKINSSLISNRGGVQQRSMGSKSSMPSSGMTMVSSLQPATPLKTKIISQPKPVIKISSSSVYPPTTMPKIQIATSTPSTPQSIVPATIDSSASKPSETPEPMDTN
ncbi:transcription initiation factor TFIID subunit 9 [Neocloeon triangulifer]|uniref:transcription initiation factor TFIID subunit 9 n=1 Tax=Neocloeon triangulifer TaxID=2078957 RepID=UPI00286F6326|nr:transcription initiation factor TFIID subunit 9 [Neocloeon triangulifer]